MLSNILSHFETEKVTATWYDGTAGANVDGVWTPGLAAGVSIRMIAPQPVKASEMTNLDDGEHISDYLKTWAEVPELGTREGLKSADEIEWKSKRYKVTQVDDRETLGGYVRVVMKRIGQS